MSTAFIPYVLSTLTYYCIILCIVIDIMSIHNQAVICFAYTQLVCVFQVVSSRAQRYCARKPITIYTRATVTTYTSCSRPIPCLLIRLLLRRRLFDIGVSLRDRIYCVSREFSLPRGVTATTTPTRVLRTATPADNQLH